MPGALILLGIHAPKCLLCISIKSTDRHSSLKKKASTIFTFHVSGSVDRGKDFYHLNNSVVHEGVPSESDSLAPSYILNYVRDEHHRSTVSHGRWVAGP